MLFDWYVVVSGFVLGDLGYDCKDVIVFVFGIVGVMIMLYVLFLYFGFM